MHPRARSRIAQLAPVVAALVVTVACGGSSSTSGAALSGTFQVGILGPYSGPAAFVGDWFKHGAAVGLSEVNSTGPIKFSAIYGDTSNDPVDAVNAWHQLQLQDPTYYIGPSAIVANAILPLYESAQKPDFTFAGSPAYDHMTYKYVYRVSPSDTELTTAMAGYALAKHLTNAVLMFSSSAGQQGEVAPLTQSFTGHGGKVLGTFQLSVNATDYRSELTQAFALHPDVIFFSALAPQAQTLFTNWRQLGLPETTWVSDDTGADLTTVKGIGLETASKDVIGLTGSPPAGPAYTHFLDVYQRVYNSRQPVSMSASVYDSMVIAALAMIAANSSDPKVWVNKITAVSNPPGQKVYTYADGVAALKAGKKIDYEGAVGADDFNQYHNIFSDYDAVQFDTSGNLHTVLTLTQAQLAQIAP